VCIHGSSWCVLYSKYMITWNSIVFFPDCVCQHFCCLCIQLMHNLLLYVGFTYCYTTWGNTTLHACIEELNLHYIGGLSQSYERPNVRNGKSRAFATIEKITKTQLRCFLGLFKCKNLLLTDSLRQIVLLPASLQLQIVCRYCDFVFGTLNMYAMTL
jgi:hypothetical protein